MTHRPATLLFAVLMLLGLLNQLRVARECCASSGLEILAATTSAEVTYKGGGASATMEGNDWWRLVTSMFVHAGIAHFLLNLIGLLQIGDLLENLFGTSIVIVTFLAGGIAAGLVTIQLAQGTEYYMGASGGIFALAGALLSAAHRIWRAERARWSRRLSSRLVGCLAFNLVLGLIVSAAAAWAGWGFAIANIAHLTGLVIGILVGLLPIPMQKNDRTDTIIRWFEPQKPAEQEPPE